MITCLFSTHYFQFHNKILNSSKFLFISNYKSCNLQITIILKILLFFVGNIYKKEKEKKSLCCTSPLIRGDELSLRSIQILLCFFQTFNVSPQFFCCFKFVIIEEIGVWYRFKQADATGLTSHGSLRPVRGITQQHHVIHSSSQGLKETPKTTKASLSRTLQIGGRWWWSPGLSGRRHHHGELICHLSQKVTKMEAGLIKKATRKVKRRTRRQPCLTGTQRQRLGLKVSQTLIFNLLFISNG